MIKVAKHQQVICGNCTTNNVTVYCNECDKFFCQECIDTHWKWAPFGDHKIKSLDEVVNSASKLFAKK